VRIKTQGHASHGFDSDTSPLEGCCPATLSGLPGPAFFTGQDRDTESNLDHFLFRQYNSTQGHWTTPDPAGTAAVDMTNPQTWNRYAYVGNNPMSRVDPYGLYCALAVGPTGDPDPLGSGFLNGCQQGGATIAYSLATGQTASVDYQWVPGNSGGALFGPFLDDAGEPIFTYAAANGNWTAIGITYSGGATQAGANNGNWFQRGLNYLKTHPVTFSFIEGLALQATYQASTKTLCINAGLGASVPPTKMFTAGVLNEGDMGKWTDVQSSWGYSFGANLIFGYQGSFNSSGKVGGPTISGVGISGSYTYGWCE
jgi:RHS repeat-associated protein